jgi:hypothetical protein
MSPPPAKPATITSASLGTAIQPDYRGIVPPQLMPIGGKRKR